MGTEVYSVNPYMRNAYSPKATFDISHGSGVWRTGTPQRRESDPAINMSKTPPETWELDVRPLIGSRKWLQNYGLKKNRLTLTHLLPQIGFKLSDDYDHHIKSPISSRYGGGLFSRIFRPDGKTFNITGSKEKLHQIKKRLSQACNLFRRRLEWLTTESRRIFGVIEEKSVTIVMDIKNMSPQQFDQYRVALERVLREQVMQLAKFNLIRASENMDMYNAECVPVTHDTVENAVQWIWNLDRLAAVSKTATCEAVLQALGDKNNEAIYLFTEGTSVDSSRELLKEKISSTELKLPIHIVSFNCDSADTIKFLKDFVKVTGGRFHAYAVVMEMDAYEAQPVDPLTNKANIVLKKKTYGGLPPGVGVREDIVLVFEELEEARNIMSQIQALIEQTPEPKSFEIVERYEKREECMSSREWLEKYGLSAQKLDLHHVLAGVAFRHKDGVVELMDPSPERTQTNAITRPKLVNARYCEQFPIARWKDGSEVHVHVTPDVHRGYEQKMEVALNKIQQRIDWLQQGSRALFGSIIEDQIYVLIDTSASMQPSIQFVKDKLFVLMQEQIRHKSMFNLVSFNSKASVWRDRLIHVNEQNLQDAWGWVQGLSCWGSTNTYAAIQQAMNDPQTQAIYLLTDGRPDQPPKSILAQVQMRNKVPIHAISFNCNDTEANRFLFELARITGGRYHSYSEDGDEEPSEEQPETYESEDIFLLHQEIKKGLDNLDQLARFRDECSAMAWKREIEALKKCSKDHPLPDTDRASAVPPMEAKDLYRPQSPVSRPQSAPPQEVRHIPTPPPRPSSAHGYRHKSSEKNTRARPHTARHRRHRPLIAYHTRTSILRTLSSSGRFSSSEWLLPETKQLFQKQAQQNPKLAQHDDRRNANQRIINIRLLRANDLSSKKWLAKNGLVAKRLTILDALSPTLVPHKATYVPILDKHVLARVFDEILPLAHVSGRKRNEIRLVNPNAVNLELYEKRLEKAIALYQRRLDKIVWDVLPESAKNEFDNQGPVSFLNNREYMLKALEEANWPIRRKEITLMEEEIGRAYTFLQQSKDLRKEAAEECADDEGSVTPVSQLRSSRESERTRDNNKNIPAEQQAFRNLKVIARNKEDGQYYPGVVKSCPTPRYAYIIFTGSDTETEVPTRFIIPIIGAVPVPTLHRGDCVLVRVLTLEKDITDSEIECFVPGIVQFTPGLEHPEFYTVVLYNKQKVTTMRKNLVKINAERYRFTVRYIIRMQKENELLYRPSNPTPPISEESTDRIYHETDLERKLQKAREKLKKRKEKNKELKKQREECLRNLEKLKQQKSESNIEKSTNTDYEVQVEKSTNTDNEFQEETPKSPSPLIEFNKSLPDISENEEVLARWPDGGWYYQCVILQNVRNNLYIVGDSTGDAEEIPRHDIITDKDDAENKIEKGDYVVAVYPGYPSSYAPGQVVRILPNNFLHITFYDKEETTLSRGEVYKLSEEKYKYDVEEILQCEQQWVGHTAIVRNDDTGEYEIATVKKKVEKGQKYLIEWKDGSEIHQDPRHMFGSFTRTPPLAKNEYVLAIASDDSDSIIYLPGEVTGIDKQTKTFDVHFCNGKIKKSLLLDENKYYWLSENYYKEAKAYFLSRHARQ